MHFENAATINRQLYGTHECTTKYTANSFLLTACITLYECLYVNDSIAVCVVLFEKVNNSYDPLHNRILSRAPLSGEMVATAVSL